MVYTMRFGLYDFLKSQALSCQWQECQWLFCCVSSSMVLQTTMNLKLWKPGYTDYWWPDTADWWRYVTGKNEDILQKPYVTV